MGIPRKNPRTTGVGGGLSFKRSIAMEPALDYAAGPPRFELSFVSMSVPDTYIFHNERVSINRVRELRIKIKNELAEMSDEPDELDSEGISATSDGPPSHASP